MKSRPILFSAPMIRALLAGTKTQTRRICKPQPISVGSAGKRRVYQDSDFKRAWESIPGTGECDQDRDCPYGRPGDRLWVKETFMREPHPSEVGLTRDMIPATWDMACAFAGIIHYRADPLSEIAADGRNWRPSIFMPRKASRLTLEVVSVRVERLQEISEADAIAEGVHMADDEPDMRWNPVQAYRHLWESINGAGSWDANPWVWVVEFKLVGNGGVA